MNKFVLANILKNFRWLKFDFSKLKHSFKMSKVFIVRFHVIQFTRYSVAFRSRGELVHISTSNFICQALFSSFLNFFEEACRLIFDLLVARRQLCQAITSAFICQELFSSFSKFLFDVLLFDCLADSLHMLPSNSSFVNRLFRTKREPLSRLSVVTFFISAYSASSIRP